MNFTPTCSAQFREVHAKILEPTFAHYTQLIGRSEQVLNHVLPVLARAKLGLNIVVDYFPEGASPDPCRSNALPGR